jgi:hypothetical protein
MFPATPKAHSNSSEIFSYNLIKFSVKKSFKNFNRQVLKWPRYYGISIWQQTYFTENLLSGVPSQNHLKETKILQDIRTLYN